MKISALKMNCGHNGRTIVEVWADCHSVEDVDDLIAWLQMAKGVMTKWDKINAKAARKAQAAAGKNESPQQGQVQSSAREPSGSDGKYPVAKAE